jgi:hypothetical protein
LKLAARYLVTVALAATGWPVDSQAFDGKAWAVVASHLSSATDAKPDSSNADTARWVRAGNTIVSPNVPPIQIEVDRQLPHIGVVAFRLKKAAEVERFVFARIGDDGRVLAMFIAQFESILPGVKGSYTFEVTNATRLGRHDYQTNVDVFNFSQSAAASPGAEADQTLKFLAKHQLKVDGDFLRARYARVTDATKRHELLLFYYEDLRDLGVTRAEIEGGGRPQAEAGGLFRDFAARSLRVLKVTDGD